jgi:hypothetical protein
VTGGGVDQRPRFAARRWLRDRAGDHLDHAGDLARFLALFLARRAAAEVQLLQQALDDLGIDHVCAFHHAAVSAIVSSSGRGAHTRSRRAKPPSILS